MTQESIPPMKEIFPYGKIAYETKMLVAIQKVTGTKKEPPDIIYLLDIGDGFVWCDVPDPEDNHMAAWEYKKVRKVRDGK